MAEVVGFKRDKILLMPLASPDGIHPGALVVNTGGATAADVRALSDHIRSVLFEKFGVNIENEIIFVE